jgi:hypothetical protein
LFHFGSGGLFLAAASLKQAEGVTLLAAAAGRAMLPGFGLVRALTARLALLPQFQILEAIVGAIAVAVMHILVGKQWASKVASHDKAVLKHRPLALATSALIEMVLVRVQQNRNIALGAFPLPHLGQGVRRSPSITAVDRLVSRVTKKVRNLVHVGAEALGNLIAGHPLPLPLQNFVKAGVQRHRPTADVSDRDAILHQDASDRFVVIAAGLPDFRHSTSSQVRGDQRRDGFNRNFTAFRHAQSVANFSYKDKTL